MSEQQFNREVDRALKYSREKLPVSAIHPALRFTRLGAVLREHAAEDSTVGSLAHAALTQPHDQPLELMPLHALRDYMQDYPEHPLASKFRWERLPEKVALDQSLGHHIEAENHKPNRYYEQDIIPADVADPHERVAGGLLAKVYNIRRRVRDAHPWSVEKDVVDSARRLNDQRVRSYQVQGFVENGDPEFADDFHSDIARNPEYTGEHELY